MSAERTWEALARAALLGTERGAPPPSPDDRSPLAAALARAGGETPEAALLRAAALVAPYLRAGRLPARDARPLPEPAAEETAPVCPPRAAWHLAAMLGGEHAVALPEWLEAAGRAGYGVPPEHLPALLDAARRDEALRGPLPAVLGARGRWLAARRPEWAFAVAGADPDAGEAAEALAWKTGDHAARLALLERVRRRDAARGRALLESTWATEASRERAALLEALETGLSMDDEPFLEAALDDRRKEVRAAAAAFLSRLAGSRLVGRMTERARRWVTVTPARAGLLARVTGAGKPAFDVALPPECDRAMVRDAVEPKPPYGMGERAWWLFQVLRVVPPSAWSQAAGAPPAACLDAAGGEWRDLLLRAWAEAAVRHGDAAWAAELLAGSRLARTKEFPPHARVPYAALTAVLPAGEREAAVRGRIEPMGGISLISPVFPMLEAIPAPWSEALTRDLVRRLRFENDYQGWQLREILAPLAPRMHPAAALEEAAALGDGARGAWLELLTHRHDMLEALKR